jgi:hypothetical protein
MSRFLIPMARGWLFRELYGSQYAPTVSTHFPYPFLYAKCLLFVSAAVHERPHVAAYTAGLLHALHFGSMDTDLVRYIDCFDAGLQGTAPILRRGAAVGPGLRAETLSSVHARTLLYDAARAAVLTLEPAELAAFQFDCTARAYLPHSPFVPAHPPAQAGAVDATHTAGGCAVAAGAAAAGGSGAAAAAATEVTTATAAGTLHRVRSVAREMVVPVQLADHCVTLALRERCVASRTRALLTDPKYRASKRRRSLSPVASPAADAC